MATALQGIIPFDCLNIIKNEASADTEQVYLVKNTLNIFQVLSLNALLDVTGISQRDYRSWKSSPADTKNQFYNNFEFRRLKMDSLWLKAISDHYKYQSALCYDIRLEGGYSYKLTFFSTGLDSYNKLQLDLLQKKSGRP